MPYNIVHSFLPSINRPATAKFNAHIEITPLSFAGENDLHMMPKVPEDSLLRRQTASVDYQDCFAANIPTNHPVSITATGLAFSTGTPAWIRKMLKLRDRIVGRFGLKTAKKLAVTSSGTLNCGDQLGIFKVLDKNEKELILGENDKHLDFRVSLYLQQQPAQQQLLCTTTVHYNNRWGRIYFFFVKPFHRLIVPAMMKSTISQLSTAGN